MAQTYRKAVDDDLPWEQKLANYSGNKNAGTSEYQRALEVYRGKSAAGDTEGANAAKKWSDQVNTAIGGIGNNRTSQINDTTDRIGQKVNANPFEFKQTQASFNYDPNNDQAYQAALKSAQSNIQTSQNNTLANLAARGQGNSSYAASAAQQIANKEMGNVSNNILPQLIQQAYGRYQDANNNDYRNQLANYQAGQDQIGNLSKYAGTLSDLDQRELDNTFRDNEVARLGKLDNQSVAQWYTQTYGKQFDPKQDWGLLAGEAQGLTPLAMQEFQQSKGIQDAGVTGIYNGNPTMQKSAQDFSQWADRQQLGISRQNANNSGSSTSNAATNARINQLMDVWDKTGVAPAGIPGVPAGTPLKGSKSTGQTASDYYKEIDSSMYLNPETVTDTLGKETKTGKTIVADPEGLENYIFSLNLPPEEAYKLLNRYKLVKE